MQIWAAQTNVVPCSSSRIRSMSLCGRARHSQTHHLSVGRWPYCRNIYRAAGLPPVARRLRSIQLDGVERHVHYHQMERSHLVPPGPFDADIPSTLRLCAAVARLIREGRWQRVVTHNSQGEFAM